MNINVVVLNVANDSWPPGVRDRGKDRDEQFSRNLSNPDTATTAVEEVIELMPQDGAWAGKGGTRAAQPAMYNVARQSRALYASPTATTYDHEGKVRYSAQDKGLRINVTA